MQNRVGQQFGNYRLLRLLGRGGFAEVYLGEHVYMQSNAAVKVLYGPLATSDAQNFLREARILAKLEHANIVGIKECDIKQGVPFLVMNYASNGVLHQRHPRGQRVPLQAVVSYVLQVASALQYAHNRNVVHRDVKPENMLIDTNGNILLSDFGIAVPSSSISSSHSRGPAGTYLYMAPEQITGNALPASDQYALGITVYEWLCGEAPFIGSPPEITAKHMQASPQPLWQRGIAIGPQVEMVIARALQKDPRLRFASVQQFAQALQSSSNAPAPGSNNTILPSPSPAPGSNNSILPSPSPKTPGFTYPPATMPPVSPSTSSLPPSPLVPTISPGTVPYVPTQLAPPYVQPRKTGFPCLATTLISFVLLLTGIGSVFIVPQISPFFSGFLHLATPSATVGITPSATVGITPSATVGITPSATNTPEELIDSFCQNLVSQDYRVAYDMYSINLKKQILFDPFRNYWTANSKQYYHIDRCDHETIPTPSGNSTTASWSTYEFYSSHIQSYYVTFIIQGNEWKIDDIKEV